MSEQQAQVVDREVRHYREAGQAVRVDNLPAGSIVRVWTRNSLYTFRRRTERKLPSDNWMVFGGLIGDKPRTADITGWVFGGASETGEIMVGGCLVFWVEGMGYQSSTVQAVEIVRPGKEGGE